MVATRSAVVPSPAPRVGDPPAVFSGPPADRRCPSSPGAMVREKSGPPAARKPPRCSFPHTNAAWIGRWLAAPPPSSPRRPHLASPGLKLGKNGASTSEARPPASRPRLSSAPRPPDRASSAGTRPGGGRRRCRGSPARLGRRHRPSRCWPGSSRRPPSRH